jgi:hypothetical protein
MTTNQDAIAGANQVGYGTACPLGIAGWGEVNGEVDLKSNGQGIPLYPLS